MSENKCNVAWLSGSYHRRRSLMLKIKGKFPDFEHISIDSSHDFSYLLSKIQSGGCFDEGRLIFVHEIPKTKNANEKKNYIASLKKLLSKPSNDCYIVFNNIPKSEKNIYSIVKDCAKIYEYEDTLYEKEAISYVLKRCSSYNLSMEAEVAQSIVSHCGSNMGKVDVDRIEGALNVLSIYSMDKKEIELSDVASAIFKYDSFGIFQMMNFIDDKDYESSVESFSDTLVHGSNHMDSIMMLINMFLARYRLVLFAREKSDNGSSLAEITDAAKMFYKTQKEGSGRNAVYSKQVDSKGNNTAVWTDSAINTVLRGFYGSDPVIDKWSRKEIINFVNILERSYIALRNCSKNESLLISDIIIMTACNKIKRADAIGVLNSITEANEYDVN